MAELWFGGDDVEYRVAGQPPRIPVSGTPVKVFSDDAGLNEYTQFKLRDGSIVTSLGITQTGKIPEFALPTNTTARKVFYKVGTGPIAPGSLQEESQSIALQEDIAVSSGGSIVHDQTTPVASASITHPFNRLVGVNIYVGGEQVDTDVQVDDTQVVVSFPAPTAFVAVIN